MQVHSTYLMLQGVHVQALETRLRVDWLGSVSRLHGNPKTIARQKVDHASRGLDE